MTPWASISHSKESLWSVTFCGMLKIQGFRSMDRAESFIADVLIRGVFLPAQSKGAVEVNISRTIDEIMGELKKKGD